MKEQTHHSLGDWKGHVLGILTEAGYVTVMLAAAALLAWAVNLG